MKFQLLVAFSLLSLLGLLFQFILLSPVSITQLPFVLMPCGERSTGEEREGFNMKLGSADHPSSSPEETTQYMRHDSPASSATKTSKVTNLLLPPNATGRAFVCVTGQVKRLVAEKIKETVLESLQEQGYAVDVALALTEDGLHSTYAGTGRWKWNPFANYEQVHRYYNSNGFHVVTKGPLSMPADPAVPPNYERNIYRGRTKEERKESCQNHWRQFKTLTKCYETLCQQQVDDGNYYDFAIRLREDVSFDEPLRMDDILPILYPDETVTPAASNGTVLSSDCRTFHGINDRLAIVSRQGFHGYFNGPWDYFLPDNSAHTIHTPESYIRYVYQTELKMNVVPTPKIRGVLKYFVDNEGAKEHPQLVTKLSPGETKALCPQQSPVNQTK